MSAAPSFAADFDRERCRLAAGVRERVIADDRRIVVAGASGWIGRTVLSLLHEALGPKVFARRVACFGSSEKVVRLISGSKTHQQPLSSLRNIGSQPSLLFQLAFLTKDKIKGMDQARYVAENRRISQDTLAAASAIGVDRIFVASSGAARFVDDPSAALDLRLYGGLKREEEDMFAAWARAPGGSRRVAIGRIFSVSGPFINKPQTYALASFINDALAGLPISVTAVRAVFRSYVAVRDVVDLALSDLLSGDAGETPALLFETGGEAVELGDLAARVAGLLGSEVVRPPMREGAPNIYCGDDAAWRGVQQRYSLCGASLEEQIRETAAYLSRELRGA